MKLKVDESWEARQSIHDRSPAWIQAGDQSIDSNNATGIYVRALSPEGKWMSVDIALLDKESLLSWLRSRGGNNPWAENVVGILLGHGNLVQDEQK